MRAKPATLLYSGIDDPATERMAFEFVKANYEEILKRAPSGGGSDFARCWLYSAASFCDAASEKEYITFFGERAKKLTGGPRLYQQELEGSGCAKRKKRRRRRISRRFREAVRLAWRILTTIPCESTYARWGRYRLCLPILRPSASNTFAPGVKKLNTPGRI